MILDRIEEKLEHFTATIMKQAVEKRNQLLEEIKKQHEETLKQKELEFLEQAYNQIQNSIRLIEKENNEVLSRTLAENRRKLLQKREEIIEEIFHEITERVKEFVKSPQYEQYLINDVLEICTSIRSEEDELIIYINEADLLYKDKITEQIQSRLYPNRFIVETEKADMIGGVKVLNKTKNLFVDNSFLAKIKEARERFLETSGLVID